MLKIEPTKQTRFILGNQVYEKLVSEDDLLHKINRHVDFSFVNDECRDLYCEDNGRPAKEPEMMVRAEIVQWLRVYSDREMRDAARYDVRVKWFLGIDICDAGFDFSLVSKFRSRLGVERHEMLFNKILEQIADKGFIPKNDISFTDATHVIANIAIPNTMKLIRQTNAKLLKLIEKSNKEIYEKVIGNFEDIAELVDTSSKKNNDYSLSTHQKKRNLEVLVRDTRQLVEVTEKLFGEKKESSHEVKESLDLLKKILDENIEESNGTTSEKKKKPTYRTPSAVDPDARHGAKSKTKKFTGYKGHFIENSNEIITAVDVTAGNVPDEDATLDLLKKQKEGIGIMPGKLGGDKKYGDGKTRKGILEEYNVEIIAPTKNKSGNNGLFTNDRFTYDSEKDSVTCPEGKTTHQHHINKKNGNKIFRFCGLCKDCPLKEKCTTNKTGRTININAYHEEYKRANEFKQTEEYKKVMSDRMKIERKQGEMKVHHGMDRARYWGLAKMKIQALLTATVVNIKRFVKLVEDGLREKISVSSVS